MITSNNSDLSEYSTSIGNKSVSTMFAAPRKRRISWSSPSRLRNLIRSRMASTKQNLW